MDSLTSAFDRASNKNIQKPLYDKNQRSAIQALQTMLGQEATGALQSMGGYARGEGFDAQRDELIRDYQETFAPALMQGAAKNNLMGSSGVVGALESGAGRLRSMLSAQQEGRKWDATQGLLDLMQSFGTKRTSDFERSESPSGLEVLLKAIQTGATGGSEEGASPWSSFASPEVLGGIGTGIGSLFGGLGAAAGGGLGAILSRWLASH